MNQVFNKDIKMEYSWLPKGITSSVVNQIHSSTKSMLTSFCSGGEYIWVLINKNVFTQVFEKFLCFLKYFLQMRELQLNNKSTIILDNAPYHWSKISYERIKKLNLNVMLLPPYSPVLAPVEIFFKLLKSKIRSSKSSIGVNFSNESGTRLIFSGCDNLKIVSRRKVWIDFIRTAIELIILLNQKYNMIFEMQ